MVLQVNIQKYPTKTAFKKAIRRGEDPYLIDPSIYNPRSGRVSELVDEFDRIYVTNHPKRSWFANIRQSKRTGRIIVE